MGVPGGFVYFMLNADDGKTIYVGSTASYSRREKDHKREGWVTVAVLRSLNYEAIEDSIQKHFVALDERVNRERGSKSQFRGPGIANYADNLLRRGFAASTYDEAIDLPPLDWDVLSPAHVEHAVSSDGQLAISAELPLRERFAWTAENSMLCSLSDEWYTPDFVAEAARDAMTSIDLDPFSCAEAQRVIKATRFYTIGVNGLSPQVPWVGNTYMNPPYGKGDGSAGACVSRLIEEYLAGNVTQAVTCLALWSASAAWFQPIHEHASAQGISIGRWNFTSSNSLSPESGSTKGNIVSYFGPNPERFYEAFSPIAACFYPSHLSIPDQIGLVA